jgi:hypothetical protein
VHDRIEILESWSRPWHALQRSLASEVALPLPSKPAPPGFAIDEAGPMSSWLARALGETAAHAHYSR